MYSFGVFPEQSASRSPGAKNVFFSQVSPPTFRKKISVELEPAAGLASLRIQIAFRGRPEKGKPSERVGRKITGLSPIKDRAAGLPGRTSDFEARRGSPQGTACGFAPHPISSAPGFIRLPDNPTRTGRESLPQQPRGTKRACFLLNWKSFPDPTEVLMIPGRRGSGMRTLKDSEKWSS